MIKYQYIVEYICNGEVEFKYAFDTRKKAMIHCENECKEWVNAINRNSAGYYDFRKNKWVVYRNNEIWYIYTITRKQTKESENEI